MIGKSILTNFLILFSFFAYSGDAWLSDEIPDLCLKFDDEKTARENLYDIREVPKSMSDVAISRLEKVSFVKLVENQAKYYLGESYEKPEGKDPYLIRAIYGHGGTGGFRFNWCGDDIFISHLSLGEGGPQNRTALILNLEKAPKNVYISMHTAL